VSFSPEAKSKMFTRCMRLCCLCRKQCGTNIEAAHIIDEAAGGSNDEDNGIPVCFDCHQEMGAYRDSHPKGNKFRAEELKQRRDMVYEFVATGKLVSQSTKAQEAAAASSGMSNGSARNPVHVIVDLLILHKAAFLRVHQARTDKDRQEALDEWRRCHPAVWGNSSSRNDTIRRLADPAKALLSRGNSRYIQMEDFNLVEECAHTLSVFAISASPMAMPEVYSKRYTTEDVLWQQWKEQGNQLMALHNMIARLQELAARAGEEWTPAPPLQSHDATSDANGTSDKRTPQDPTMTSPS
jgi:HNH endonuclease